MNEEILPVVDNKGKQIGRATRKECHSNPGLLHPVVHLHLFRPDGRLYLQQRAFTKELYPGIWDTAVGGHISDGENISESLFRESLEELGIDVSGAEFLLNYIWRNDIESEYVYSYKLAYSGPVNFNPEEINDGRFFTSAEIYKMIGEGVVSENFCYEYRLLKTGKYIK